MSDRMLRNAQLRLIAAPAFPFPDIRRECEIENQTLVSVRDKTAIRIVACPNAFMSARDFFPIWYVIFT